MLAFRLQFVGIGREKYVAADADLAVVERDATGSERAGEGFFQRHAALFFLLAFLDFGFETAHQFELHAKHANQDQHEGTEQAGHQVAENGPDRGVVFNAGVDLFHVQASLAAGCELATRCRSLTMRCCDMMLRSMISRAWAT